MMKKRPRYTMADLLVLNDVVSESFKETLSNAERPAKLYGKVVPETLNGLTYGQLIELQEATDPITQIAACANAVLGVNDMNVIMAEDGVASFGFLLWIKRELERINGLFKELEYQPTPEEVQAGYYSLRGGRFATLDWYARRMGITNHDDVLAVSWLIYYECKRIDHEQFLFQRRVQDIRDAKAKARTRR